MENMTPVSILITNRINYSSSARVIVSVGFFFFAQDLVSHAATLNPDQSKQIVNACDYL